MNPLSLTGRRWELASVPNAEVTRLAAQLRLPPVAARCLLQRSQADTAPQWMAPSLEHLHDPHTMRGLDAAVDRVRRAARDGHRVRIVTDYDVDGTTSSLILQRTLGLVGCAPEAVDYHIPHRMDEGYGLSVRAVEAAVADGVGLLITADIGVRDHAAVTAAANAGLDVLICDHHLPAGEAVPEGAYAVLCPPQQGCDYPNKALAACGVSFKLAQALLLRHPKRDRLLSAMLKMAAIGTVADVVDLGSLENRAIVALGLEALRAGPHSPGLAALLEVAAVDQASLSAMDLGFRLGPRINAAGRLAEATAVVELFNSRDPLDAKQRAKALDRLNRARQGIQEQLLSAAQRSLPDPPPPFVVLWGSEEEGWHRGIAGIVAARLRDQLHRPAAVIAVAGDEARGSVRSTPEVHAVRALDAAADLLSRWGGHPVAAGFTLPAAKLPALAERLAAFAEAAAGAPQPPALRLDAAVNARDLDWGVVAALERLGPHGKGNPAPLLLIEADQLERPQRLGTDHLRFSVGKLDAIWWRGAAQQAALRGPVALAATAGFHVWQGRRSVRLTVEDARLAAPPAP